jgi:hypothetical protein
VTFYPDCPRQLIALGLLMVMVPFLILFAIAGNLRLRA